MQRLFLIIIYVILSFIYYYFPNLIVNDGKVFTFSLICVYLLKELDWLLIKKTCLNSKDKFCEIFKKTKKENKQEDKKEENV